MTKNVLSLFQLEARMDEIVFDYIDTSQKYETAKAKLDELVNSMVEYFSDHVKVNGDLPKGNTYWVLFMNVASKLIYFHTISYYHLKVEQKEDVKNEVIELLRIAANCLPNVHEEGNAEFLDEVAKSFEEIQPDHGKHGDFKKMILDQNNRPKDCFEAFLKYTNNKIK